MFIRLDWRLPHIDKEKNLAIEQNKCTMYHTQSQQLRLDLLLPFFVLHSSLISHVQRHPLMSTTAVPSPSLCTTVQSVCLVNSFVVEKLVFSA